PPWRSSSKRRAPASWRYRPASCRGAAASPRRSGPIAGPPEPRQPLCAAAPEPLPSAYRRDLTALHDQLFVPASRYLELTIFYHASVTETTGTPFAWRPLWLQWRSGE